MTIVSSIRSALLPFCTGKNGTLGSNLAQKLRCQPLDLFFKHFPLLGCSDHYSICIPLISWLCGDMISLKLFVSLSIVFYISNATKDILTLPRPKGNVKLEISYLEEYGFPSTHTAASVVWATALCEILKYCGFSKHIVTFASVGYTVLIMFCRLYLGVHSLADLVGGFQIGIFTVMTTEVLLVPIIETVILDQEACVTYNLIFRNITIDGTVLVSAVIGSLILLFPDKRQGRTSYGDVLNMVSLTMGATLLIGGRIRDGMIVPFGGDFDYNSSYMMTLSNKYQQLIVSVICNYLCLGAVDLIGSYLRKNLESSFGFSGGVFYWGKGMLMGIGVTMLTTQNFGKQLDFF